MNLNFPFHILGKSKSIQKLEKETFSWKKKRIFPKKKFLWDPKIQIKMMFMETEKFKQPKKKRVNDQTNKQPISTVLSCVCQSKQKSKERFVCLFFFCIMMMIIIIMKMMMMMSKTKWIINYHQHHHNPYCCCC